MRRALAFVLALPLVGLAACKPDFGAPLSAVTATRIAAVRFEPPEAPPGAGVSAAAFVVSPDGALTPPVDWSLCLTPKSTTNNDVVDPSCLAAQGTSEVGTTAQAQSLALPSDACRLFGPDTPPPAPGQPPLQSRAPDVTGGYYQPVRAELDGGAAPTIGLCRLRCALAGASAELAAQYAATYTSNRNPALTPLSALVDGAPVALDALPAGRAVTLVAGWSADSPESFPVLDAATQTLVTHREAMTVSWLATTGVIATATTGRAEDDLATWATTTWTAPASPGPVRFFVVLHDSRGGVDFAAVDGAVR